MERPPVELVLCDVGGVILSNGWDTASRRRVTGELGMDWDEFSERHAFVVDSFETGGMDLHDYINFTVLHRPRDLTVDDFAELMRAQSLPSPGGLELAADLGASSVGCVTLNNESRPLGDHRITAFGLHRWFDAFFTSGYLGVKKPHTVAYRLAIQVMAVPADRCVFIDDRAMNLEPAAALGIHTVHHVDATSTREALADLGVDLSDPSGPPTGTPRKEPR